MSGTSGNSASTPGDSDTMVRSKGKSRTGLYAVVAVVVVIVIILGAGYAAGWFKTSSTPATSKGCTLPAATTLSGAGSTLVAPLMIAWSLAYTASTVNYQGVGSGAGISDITAKTVDFGASDAPLNPAQRAAVPSPGVVTIPESAGAAVPIYNLPSVGTTLKFTGQILAEIYLGTMTNWNNSVLQAVNPGVVLPTAAIVVVHRSDGSGTTFVWSSFLSDSNATWASTLGHSTTINWPVGVGSKGNSGVTATVKSTTDAIGYVDINYALTNGVAFGAVQNPTGNYIVANVTNIESAIKDANPTFPAATGDWYNVSVLNAPGAHDYPLATLTYLFVYTDIGVAYGASYTQAKAQNLVDFLAWIVSTTGQSYSAPLYYVPLSSTVAAADLTTINSLKYNGALLTACVPTS
ncbi:MAG TPA: phosphate ABC transporter substrate-binding protein PstS [Thermoplasmata archaeon]|nr:phosphate ABC transporter substrate-binding protein PstS [Thermoplasmata archaeon]